VQQAAGQTLDLETLSLSAILMLARDPNEAAFVWSLVNDVMKADLWLWHENDFNHAVQVLSYCRFRLILLDSTFGKRLSARALVRRIRRWPGALPSSSVCPRRSCHRTPIPESTESPASSQWELARRRPAPSSAFYPCASSLTPADRP